MPPMKHVKLRAPPKSSKTGGVVVNFCGGWFSDGTELTWSLGTQPRIGDEPLTRRYWDALFLPLGIVLRLERGPLLPHRDVAVPYPASAGAIMEAVAAVRPVPLAVNVLLVLST